MAERYPLLVVGAGPAGLAAAATAAAHGARVGVIDLQPRAGGQVWRHDVAHAPPSAAAKAIDALAGHPNIAVHLAAQVIDARRDSLLVERAHDAIEVRFDRLALATGARELLLPFPGWTLPGVTGAGGLQALAKQGLPLAGKRVVIGGSGALLLASAATLKKHGARVLAVVEQAPRARVMAFASGLWRWPARAVQAAQLRLLLAGVPMHHGQLVAEAHGATRLEAVTLRDDAGRTQTLACDYAGIGYGLVPNVELAQRLGCALIADTAHPRVAVDAWQRTSVAHVFAAGETCGIGGLASARLEGRIAAFAALDRTDALAPWQRRRDRARAFAAALAGAFQLQPAVRTLARPDTLVCRCEDVPLGALDGYADARDAKLATRCGMGACQGRICGTALAELGRYPSAEPREPLFPARLASLAGGDFSTL